MIGVPVVVGEAQFEKPWSVAYIMYRQV